MATVEEIKEAIQSLPKDDQAALRRWFYDTDWQAWDQEIERDSRSGNLDGLSFVISGTFTKFSREELKELIETNGGKNLSGISSKTNFVVSGENTGPGKLQKAQELNIKIISEYEFLEMIG